MTEIEPTLVGGIETRVFDLDGRSTNIQLKLTPEAEFGWGSPPLGRFWLLGHPERGLFMLTAEARGPNPEDVLPLSIAEVEAILGSLEFIERGSVGRHIVTFPFCLWRAAAVSLV